MIHKLTLEEYTSLEETLKKTKNAFLDTLVKSNLLTNDKEIRPLSCNRSIQTAITNIDDALTNLHVEKYINYPEELADAE